MIREPILEKVWAIRKESRLSCGAALAALAWACLTPGALAQGEYGFVNTRPSGQPYLAPEESVKRMRVPPGWEVKVFAAEPDIINPIAFSIDERGRLWVVECYEYPKRTPPGKKARDLIKILEDTTGSGRADKVTVWAEGKELPRFDLASGIEVGHAGVFLGAAPYLMFLRDSKGSGHCDQHEILLSGFGSQDTHEVLNTLQWGPDGRLHGLHGIFTQSRVGAVRMDAAVWRYDVGTRKFDILAEGTSNPWGLDFDAHGQAFLACCVIPHCFHMIPGGTYIRQAGASQNPYAYGLLREICDHTHHAESGWAHAGMLVMEGDHVPADYRNSLLMGSIHGTSIKRDVLERHGSTFVARHAADFLTSGDKNFRPINMRWGPDGSIYVIDWHDQNPCHQALPDSWDMTHGRIYKIQRTGTKSVPTPDLSRKASAGLVDLLKNSNPWWHRTAARLLAERQDRTVTPQLLALLNEARDDALVLRALWALQSLGALDEHLSSRLLGHPSPWVRSWTIRLLGEPGRVSEDTLDRFTHLAETEPAAEVRSQLASTAQRLTGQNVLPLLHNLMGHKEDATDPNIPLMIWLAYEPHVPREAQAVLNWLTAHAGGNPLVANEIVPRVMRRLVATERPQDLAACLVFVGGGIDSPVRRQALEGLLLALGNRQTEPSSSWRSAFATLLHDPDPDVVRLSRRLAVKFHDPAAVQRALAICQDRARPLSERLEATRDLATAHPAEALPVLEKLLSTKEPTDLRCEACRALSVFENPEIPGVILKGWQSHPSAVRVEAINLLAGRKEWAHALLEAIRQKQVPANDLTNNTILRIRAFHDPRLNTEIEAVWGRVREVAPAELETLIRRMRLAMDEGPCSFEKGRKVFENQCSKCHRFEGKGHEVGPNLDGAGRDIDYLLVNILDPNRVVGQPYFTRYVVLKNGRVETGLLAAEDKQSITLKGENDALKIIPRNQIEDLSVQQKSLMPEGLDKNLSVQDFRDLVRYVMANPFLTEVTIKGPYGVDVPAIDLNNPVPLGDVNVTLRPPSAVGPTGRIPLPAPKEAGDVVSYVIAQVFAPEKMSTRLLLGSGSPVTVLINGKTVYYGTPGNRPLPDQAGVDVVLDKGLNRVVFRVRYRAARQSLYARFIDQGRKLSYGP